jgi:1-deoxy-D-xylulose-5-phosphate reductoisomerase|tara:strand:+ start:1029 stop:2198 length:1170 start_codon:yes stop_codon:yes gene_type:complete
MKKKIAILGSTGSIGKNLINIIEKEKNKFQIDLISAHKDYNTLLRQVKKFKVKNIIITDPSSYLILKKKTNNLDVNIFNNYRELKSILKKKVDYVMSSITGVDGLYPTINIIKHTKKIAIANKESIICGWGLIQKELNKYQTEFIPVDSEHFSLWYSLKNMNINLIERIYLTASGGPFFKLPLNKFKNIDINKALKHPTWKMGNKISIDSATMINKVYEVIEAKNIFKIPYNKIDILVHPKSYIHAIVKFKNGLIKIIAHDTTMKIPIFNTLYFNTNKTINTSDLNLGTLNNLNLIKIDSRRYPMIKLLNLLTEKHTLYDTIVVSANDVLVELFLQKKIKFTEINSKLFKYIKDKEFLKYRNIYPKNLNDILDLNKYVRLKVLEKVYKS